MVVRFHNSGFESLRAFVNYDFATGFWQKVLVGALLGATIGLVAGLSARMIHHFEQAGSAGSTGVS
jgi:hypothetical protein